MGNAPSRWFDSSAAHRPSFHSGWLSPAGFSHAAPASGLANVDDSHSAHQFPNVSRTSKRRRSFVKPKVRIGLSFAAASSCNAGST